VPGLEVKQPTGDNCLPNRLELVGSSFWRFIICTCIYTYKIKVSCEFHGICCSGEFFSMFNMG
jgi:hypothetical protein